MASQHFAVMFNFGGDIVPVKRVEKVFNQLKDWYRFSSQAWIVYTALSPAEVRERLKVEFSEEKPTIIVIGTENTEWAAFAKKQTTDWLKVERDDSIEGD